MTACPRSIIKDITSPLLPPPLHAGVLRSWRNAQMWRRQQRKPDHPLFMGLPHNITGGPNAPTGAESLVQSEAHARTAEFPRTGRSGSWGRKERPHSDGGGKAANVNALCCAWLTCSRTRGRGRRRAPAPARAAGGCSGCPRCCCSCRSCACWRGPGSGGRPSGPGG